MAYADLENVRIADRELGPDDEVADWVDALLEQAEAQIRLLFGDLDARVADGRTDPVLLRQVEGEMVAAVTKNPQSYQSSSEGVSGLTESRTFNLAAASGLIRFTEDQQAIVAGTLPGSSGGSGRAFTIRPGAR